MKLTLHLLHDDRPTGPRIAKLDQWSGRALCVPREDLDEVQKRKELDAKLADILKAKTLDDVFSK